MQSCYSLHCSRTYTQWVYTWHVLSVHAQTSLSMRAVSPEPSHLLHMHNMGIHTAYSINQCSDSPEHACSLARAFTALAHAQNGRTYGIFLQSLLRRDIVSYFISSRRNSCHPPSHLGQNLFICLTFNCQILHF